MSIGMLSLQMTITGMTTVFIILSLLGLIMYGFKVIFNRENEIGPFAVAQVVDNPAGKQADEEEELVAVIAAASFYARLKWKRPVVVHTVTPEWEESHQPSWLEAGRHELINSRTQLRRAQ